MLLDAIAAERFRLWRDRGAVFWGFAFPGLATFVLTVLATLFVRYVAKGKIPGLVNLGSDAVGALQGVGSPVTQLFFLIGAAAIFATDYRWETWRLQTPRNSRLNLMLARFAAYGGACAAALLLIALAGVLGGLARAVIETSPLEPVVWSTFFPSFLRSFAGSWLELMVLGSLAAVIAVASRSTMAAVIVSLVAAFAQAIILGNMRYDPTHPPWNMLTSFPGLSASVVRGVDIAPGGVSAQGAELAAAILAGWIVVLAGATIALFHRQELTRE